MNKLTVSEAAECNIRNKKIKILASAFKRSCDDSIFVFCYQTK